MVACCDLFSSAACYYAVVCSIQCNNVRLLADCAEDDTVLTPSADAHRS